MYMSTSYDTYGLAEFRDRQKIFAKEAGDAEAGPSRNGPGGMDAGSVSPVTGNLRQHLIGQREQ